MTGLGAPPLNRRKLLAGLGAGLAVAGLSAAPAFADARRLAGKSDKPKVPLAKAGVDDWAGQIGSDFQIRGESGVQTLRLVEVRRFAGPAPRGGRTGRSGAFAAVFAGGGSPLPLGNRTYPVSHATSGAFNVFFGAAGENLVAIFG